MLKNVPTSTLELLDLITLLFLAGGWWVAGILIHEACLLSVFPAIHVYARLSVEVKNRIQSQG